MHYSARSRVLEDIDFSHGFSLNETLLKGDTHTDDRHRRIFQGKGTPDM